MAPIDVKFRRMPGMLHVVGDAVSYINLLTIAM